MSNLDFDVKCIPPYQLGICENSAVAFLLSRTGGITECTVGVVASGADYASVADALAAGRQFIRIVGDLTTSPPGGTFVEPTGFSISSPTMIYITPGATWVLRESVIGASGIDISDQTLIVRGSGWSSIMSVDHDVVAANMILTTAPSSLFLLDVRLETDDNLTFLGFPYNLFYIRNCDLVCTTNTGTAVVFTVPDGAGMEVHSSTFEGGGVAVAMVIGSVSASRILVNDCVATGTYLPIGGGEAFDFSSTAGDANVLIDGFLCQQSGTMAITLNGGSAQGIHQTDPTLTVRVTLNGVANLSNSSISNIVLIGNGHRLTDVDIMAMGSPATISTDNNILTGCTFGSDLTISGDGNQLTSFAIGSFIGGSTDNLTVTGANCEVASGKVSNIMILGSIGVVGSRTATDVHCFGLEPPDATTSGSSIVGHPATNITDHITVHHCQFDQQPLRCEFGNYSVSDCVINGDWIFGSQGVASQNVQFINNITTPFAGTTGRSGAVRSGQIGILNDAPMLNVRMDGNIINASMTFSDTLLSERSGGIVSNNTFRNLTQVGSRAWNWAFGATLTGVTEGFKIINNHWPSAGTSAFEFQVGGTPVVAPLIRNLEVAYNRCDNSEINIFSRTPGGAGDWLENVDIHDNICVENDNDAIAVGRCQANSVVKINNNIVGTNFAGGGAANIRMPVGGVGGVRSVAVGNIIGSSAAVFTPNAPEVGDATNNLFTI